MRALIIDSDVPFASRLREALEARGASVEVTADGFEGLELARAKPTAAVILSVELGDRPSAGFALCNRIKKDELLEGARLVLTSSLATEQTFEQHRKLKTRADEYLLKPFDPEELVARLEDLLPAAEDLDDGPVASLERARPKAVEEDVDTDALLDDVFGGIDEEPADDDLPPATEPSSVGGDDPGSDLFSLDDDAAESAPDLVALNDDHIRSAPDLFAVDCDDVGASQDAFGIGGGDARPGTFAFDDEADRLAGVERTVIEASLPWHDVEEPVAVRPTVTAETTLDLDRSADIEDENARLGAELSQARGVAAALEEQASRAEAALAEADAELARVGTELSRARGEAAALEGRALRAEAALEAAREKEARLRDALAAAMRLLG
ncbi:response regulator transcription factor [Vulgatibacter incomptus]|uniref:Response regulator n=1 Tax=Vulgatibacter incomptus TaxID=1391653 RepID=A0A0K1PE19_9BACT|nr:response regulator [Vulgatibacter incomptus]AKU91671.1 Response regulator [Vulgatibacter incomptus]